MAQRGQRAATRRRRMRRMRAAGRGRRSCGLSPTPERAQGARGLEGAAVGWQQAAREGRAEGAREGGTRRRRQGVLVGKSGGFAPRGPPLAAHTCVYADVVPPPCAASPAQRCSVTRGKPWPLTFPGLLRAQTSFFRRMARVHAVLTPPPCPPCPAGWFLTTRERRWIPWSFLRATAASSRGALLLSVDDSGLRALHAAHVVRPPHMRGDSWYVHLGEAVRPLGCFVRGCGQ